MSFSIHRAAESLAVEVFTFPGGEIGVKLDTTNLRYLYTKAPHQTIFARLQTSADVMTLVMIVDALRHLDDTPIRLFMPYTPYARQDRVCVKGEAHSLKAFARLINGLAFEKVTVLDPHSYVTEACFDRFEAITQCQIIQRWDALTTRLLLPNVTLVAPDAGSNKKVSEAAQYLAHSSFLRADKLRDLNTGKILETIVYADDLRGQEVAIVDDLCDGGRTFIELTKVLKAKGAAKVLLYTTHAILSAGADALFNGGIDEIWVTDSFRIDIDPRVKVLDTSLFLT